MIMTHNDEHVERATTFRGYDAPTDERLDGSETLYDYYDRLSVANSLDWNGKWRDEKRATQKDASAILDAVAAHLELTDYQKSESHRRFSSLPNRLNQHYQTSLLAIAVCAVVGYEDGRKYHPTILQDDTDDPPYAFAELVSDIDVTFTEFYRCWSDVQMEAEQ